MIFDVKCLTETNLFVACVALWWKRMTFIVLPSFKNVYVTVQYRYCNFSLLNRLLRIRLKCQNSLLSYLRERDRKYTANVKCCKKYTFILLNLMWIMFYLRKLSIKLYRIYACYTNITLNSYDFLYSLRYYPRFSVTAVGRGTYYHGFGRAPALKICLNFSRLYGERRFATS